MSRKLATPEPAPSLQLNPTVTGPLYQPALLLGVVAAPVMVGAVVSMLIPVTVNDVWLPAASVAVPVTLWFWPSVLIV